MMTTKTLRDVTDYVQGLMREVAGMREAPDRPPDKIGRYPFATCYPFAGEVWFGEPEGRYRGLHQLALEVHVARKDLARDFESSMALLEPVLEALGADVTLGGTVETLVGEVTYTYGPLLWFGQDTLGWRFLLRVKIHNVLAS